MYEFAFVSPRSYTYLDPSYFQPLQVYLPLIFASNLVTTLPVNGHSLGVLSLSQISWSSWRSHSPGSDPFISTLMLPYAKPIHFILSNCLTNEIVSTRILETRFGIEPSFFQGSYSPEILHILFSDSIWTAVLRYSITLFPPLHSLPPSDSVYATYFPCLSDSQVATFN